MKILRILTAIIMMSALFAGCAKESETVVPVPKDVTTAAMKADSVVQTGNMARLVNALKKVREQKEITIVLLGGSITYGSGGSGETTYSNIVKKWFVEKFPDANIKLVNAGVSGTDSVLGIHRLKKDVLVHNPDLVIVEFAVNDGVDGDGELRNIEQSYAFENIIRDVLNTPQNAAVLPVFCAVEGGYNSQKDKIKTGIHYNLPMVSYLDAVMPAINEGTLSWSDITKDGIHPNKVGHRLLGALVNNMLDIALESIDETYELSEMPGVLTKASYTDADLINSSGPGIKDLGGFEEGTYHWIYKKGWNAVKSNEPLILEIECRSLQILLNKTIDSHGAFFDITVDEGKQIRISTKSDSTYDMLTSDLIFTEEISKLHKIEIVLADDTPEGCDGTNDEILGILVSH